MRSVLPRIVAFGLAALLLVAQTPHASAQAVPPSDAQKAFEEGKKAYNLGQFDKAVELWTKAYQLKPNPVFLYNIAQAHRQKRDFAKAIFFYKSYLREAPQAPNRADVETKITDMQKLLDEQNKTGDGPPQGALDPNKPEPIKPEPVKPEPVKPEPGKPEPGKPEPAQPDDTTPKSGKTLKIAGMATGGAGVALLVVGIVFSVSAKSTATELEDHVASGMPWSQELSDKEASGKTKSTLGIVFLSLGSAAVLTGGALFVLGMMKDKQATREHAGLEVIPTIGPGTAHVSLRWTF